MANKFLNGIEVSSSAVVDGGSLSTGSTILDIQGSQGQLFSVTNSLVGDLFSVSDISGVPILKVNSSGAVNIDGTLTSSGNITGLRLRAGDGTDGYFYSDSAGRTAFRDGDFYIQSNVSNAYNYATNNYHGSTSGDNQLFRGNPLSGDNWSITAAGVITAITFSGDLNGTINTATTGVTQTAGDDSTLIATTAYADAAATAIPIGDYLPLAGGTMANTNLVTNMNADLLDGKDYTDFGATLATYGSTAGASGRIRITAPFNTNSGHMFQITVSIYSSYTIHTYVVGGYMYSTTNQWHGAQAVYSGTGVPDIVVGRDSSGKAYISIANGNYTGVRVHNMTLGYYTSIADTYDPWAITIDGAVPDSVTPSVYKTWTSGNDGAGSGLDADKLDGQEGTYYLDYANFTGTPTIPTVGDGEINGATSGLGITGSMSATANQADDTTFTVTSNAVTAATASTIAYRTTSGDLNVRLLKADYQDQTTISGAMAYRVNNGADNYTRYCSSPSAIRTFLGVPASGDLNNYLLNTTDTFTGALTINGDIRGNGQQLVLNAGESYSYATGQTSEYVFANAENGLIVSSSPDNWASGWAGRNTAFINQADGSSVFPGDIKIESALLSNQENTDIDSAAAEVVAQVSITDYTAAFFDFVVKKGTNVRSGTVYACHDGTNVEFTETSTNDLGDTSDVTLSVDKTSTNLRLIATVTSNDWSVKSLIRAI